MRPAALPERRWYLLAVSTATMMLVLGMPSMAMPVLFKEISADLGLSLVQIGTIWGFSGLAAAAFSLIGGPAGDLYGAKWVLGLGCVAAGLLGATRGLSNGYAALAVTTLLMGMACGAIPMNVVKTVSQWFPAASFGMANSILAFGAGVGATLGSLVSASVLSPWLGGWHRVTFLYGAIAFAVGLAWLLTPNPPGMSGAAKEARSWSYFRGISPRVLVIRGLWLLILVNVCYGAANQGFVGYLPLYLVGSGWSRLDADTALSVYSASSIVGVLPLAMLAQRLPLRRAMLVTGALVAFGGQLLLVTFSNGLVWPVVVLMGLFREAFIVVTFTMIVQTAGVGPKFASTALGVTMFLSGLAGFASPSLGNGLARFGSGYPFVLWAAFASVAGLLLYFLKESIQTEAANR